MTLGNYNAEVEVFNALRNDEELSTLSIGGFHNRVAKQNAPFPRIVYTQLSNNPTHFADDDEARVTVDFQVSVFTTAETIVHEIKMIKAVDRIMKSLEYGKYDQQGLFETDTKLNHAALRYSKNYYGGNE